MNKHLLKGNLVRLGALDAEKDSRAFSRWARDSEYWRLLAADPSRPISVERNRRWIEELTEKESINTFVFSILTLEDDRLIGAIDLDGIEWSHRDAFVGISIGEREYWGKGYGTDAMRLILRFAFSELNLERVSLTTFEYNPRAIRSYLKAGFSHEGRLRSYLNRDGVRYDMLFMGILREEWLKTQTGDAL